MGEVDETARLLKELGVSIRSLIENLGFRDEALEELARRVTGLADAVLELAAAGKLKAHKLEHATEAVLAVKRELFELAGALDGRERDLRHELVNIAQHLALVTDNLKNMQRGRISLAEPDEDKHKALAITRAVINAPVPKLIAIAAIALALAASAFVIYKALH